MVGDVVGNHRLIRKIGEGGMGAVYVAEHVLIGRQAAIKVLLRETSYRQDLVTRFFNEARAATAVKHPGIVEIYDFGYHTDGAAYIVMEYLEGESLAMRLARTGPLPAARTLALCRNIASALGAAHAKGIVHRDLKPDNIFIVPDPDIAGGERTKILDFGIAKLAANDQRGISKTITGTVLGTPAYMSPEQSKGAGNVDARADLYALGCILFEMVCGRPPFVAEGGGEVMAQHIYAPVPAPSSFVRVAPALEQLMLRSLAKEPAQRFQSADEMVAAMNAAIPAGGLLEPGASGATRYTPPALLSTPIQTTLNSASATMRAAGASRPRGWVFPAIAAMAIAAVITAIGLGRTTSGEERAAKLVEPAPVPAPEQRTAPAEPPVPPAPATPAAAPPTPAPTPAAPVPAPSPAEPPPPKVTIHLASEPRGAEVVRLPEHARIGITPLTYAIDLAEGNVELVVKKRGYVDKQLTVPANHDSDQTVTLARVASPPREPKPAADTPGAAAKTEADGKTLDPFDKLTPKPGR